MDCNFPFLIRRYSTFRNDLPFVVWQRYFTKASSPPVETRSSSKCLMKLICVFQHCSLKAFLLMWSSPAALEKVKLSARRLSTGPQSFCSQAAYHFRTISSFVKFCAANALALAAPGRLTAPTNAQAPAASRLLRDTAIVVLVIVRSPFHDEVRSASPDSRCCPSRQTAWYVNSAKLILETPMRSTSLAVARRAQGPQPVHNVSDPRFYYFRILSVLCQRTVAFDHRDQ